MEKETKIINWERDLVQHRAVSAVEGVEFVCERMSYIVLRVCWCNAVLNVHAPSEEVSDDSRDNFYEELEHVCEYFPKCLMYSSVRKI